jgi:hypothetical protein
MKPRLIIASSVSCYLVLFGLATLVTACPPPVCPDCYYWNGYECYCHNPCCEEADCTGQCDTCGASCMCEDDQSQCPGECDYCWNGFCYDDQTKCSGCCTCSGGTCVNDQSKCSGCCKCSGCNCVDDETKCDADECCIDCECVDPMCDNCHYRDPITQYECWHDRNSTECDSAYCLKNVLDTATCDNHGDSWPCDKRNCNTAPDGSLPAIIQTNYLQTGVCPTGGDPVVYSHWQTYTHGCGSTCWDNTWNKACGVETCDTGSPIGEPNKRGQKYKCGCP